MRKYAVLLTLGLGGWTSGGTAFAAPLELFGVPLLGATRQTLEPALIHAGFSPIHNEGRNAPAKSATASRASQSSRKRILNGSIWTAN